MLCFGGYSVCDMLCILYLNDWDCLFILYLDILYWDMSFGLFYVWCLHNVLGYVWVILFLHICLKNTVA